MLSGLRLFYPSKISFDRCDICPATLPPYPSDSGVRPEALRPTLSSGLLLSSSTYIDGSFFMRLISAGIRCKKNAEGKTISIIRGLHEIRM
jgi:hypothetical protein